MKSSDLNKITHAADQIYASTLLAILSRSSAVTPAADQRLSGIRDAISMLPANQMLEMHCPVPTIEKNDGVAWDVEDSTHLKGDERDGNRRFALVRTTDGEIVILLTSIKSSYPDKFGLAKPIAQVRESELRLGSGRDLLSDLRSVTPSHSKKGQAIFDLAIDFADVISDSARWHAQPNAPQCDPNLGFACICRENGQLVVRDQTSPEPMPGREYLAIAAKRPLTDLEREDLVRETVATLGRNQTLPAENGKTPKFGQNRANRGHGSPTTPAEAGSGLFAGSRFAGNVDIDALAANEAKIDRAEQRARQTARLDVEPDKPRGSGLSRE